MGSIMPVSPRNTRSLSRYSGALFSGFSAQSRFATARTRSALSAMALLLFRISRRFASVMGRIFPLSK